MTNYASQFDIDQIGEALKGDQMNTQRLHSLVSDVSNAERTAKHWEHRYTKANDVLGRVHAMCKGLINRMKEKEISSYDVVDEMDEIIFQVAETIEKDCTASVIED